jgi:hypothetical protein
MIINHRHQFIFIHVPKTGGTSIRKALLAVHGSKDIKWGTKHLTMSEFLAKKPLWMRGKRYRSFGFVRNPWDRVVSLHRYLCKEAGALGYPSPPPFPEFVLHLGDPESWIGGLHSAKPQSTFFPSSNCTVGRYENFLEDAAKIADRCAIRLSIPHLNSSGERVDYRMFYDDRTSGMIEDLYKLDIDRFSYAF